MSRTWVFVLGLAVVACSGSRDEEYGSDKGSAVADAAVGDAEAVETPPPAPPAARRPAKGIQLGPNGTLASSKSYRARIQLSFPRQNGVAESSRHRMTLLPGGAQ